MEWKEGERRKNHLRGITAKAAGMFDMQLDCEDGVRSQMCVFVIKQVWVFHLEENAGEKGLIFQRNHSGSLYVFYAKEPHTAISPSSPRLPHCPRPLITSFRRNAVPLWFVFLWKAHEFIEGEQVGESGRLFVDCLEFDSQPVFNSAIGKRRPNVPRQTPASLIRALPRPSCVNLLPRSRWADRKLISWAASWSSKRTRSLPQFVQSYH